MVRRAAVVVLGLTFVILAGAYVQTIGTIAQEPLWAYGFAQPPAYDDPAPPPQNLPTRNLRANESAENQLRPRHINGSSRTYSLLETRDAHNVVDWFGDEHRATVRQGDDSAVAVRATLRR